MKKRMYIVLAIVIALSAVLTVVYARMVPSTMVVNNNHPASTTTVAPTHSEATSTSQNAGKGTYAYQCDEHVGMTLTPSADVKTIAIKPVGGSYPPATTLKYVPALHGVRYEGGGVVMTAKGETVTLGEGNSAINCSPAEMPDMAPFNFGN
jgi:membrane-bound inhibitor of C-type lysozyme